MDSGKSTGFVRCVIAICCAAVFVCLGLYPVIKFLPQDVRISQSFFFLPPLNSQPTPQQWQAFLNGEKIAIVRLVKQGQIAWPLAAEKIAKKIQIEIDDQTASLNVCLRSTIRQDFQSYFQQLIDNYIRQWDHPQNNLTGNADSESIFTMERSTPDTAPYQSLLLEQLESKYQRRDQLHDRLIDLRLKHHQLNYETLALERQRDPSQSQTSVAFDEYIEPIFKNIIENDSHLRQMRLLLETTRRQRDGLDLQAGQAKSPRQLSDIEDEQNQLNRQMLALQRQIDDRRNETHAEMRQRMWPQFRDYLKDLIHHNQQQLDDLTSQQAVIDDLLKQTEKIITELKKELSDDQVAAAQGEAHTPAVPQTFQPQLDQPIPLLLRQLHFGRLRIYALLTIALTGALIGWIVSATTTAFSPQPKTKPSKRRKGKSGNWMEESDQPLEPVVIGRPETHPITQAQPPKNPHKPQIKKTKKTSPAPKETAASQPQVKPQPVSEIKPIIEEPQEKTVPVDTDKNVTPAPLEKEPDEKPKKQDEQSIKPEPLVETTSDQLNGFDPDAEPGALEQCEPYAQMIDKLRATTSCPFIVISSLNGSDTSPRFVADLAIVMQHRRRRVLLIEADQASTVLAEKVFQFQTTPGFYEWRRGDAWVSQVSCETHLRDITFMPAGTADPSQCYHDLDLSKEAHRWSNLKTKFDVVLLFSPSALSQKSKPAHNIAAGHLLDLADGLFVLTRSRNSDKIEQKLQAILAGKSIRKLDLVSIKK